MSNLEYPFTIRDGMDDDWPFVLSTWKKSFRASPPARWVTEGYFDRVNQAYEDIRERAKLIIAADQEDPHFVSAYIVHDGDCVHYAFTRGLYRRLGVMGMLWKMLPESVTTYSHITLDGAGLVKDTSLRYDPTKAFPRDNPLYWAPPWKGGMS